MLNRGLQGFGLIMYRGLAKSGVLSNPIARSAFLKAYGLYKKLIEAGPVDQLQRFIPPGAAVVDIGANVGFFTIKFAQWVGPSGKVFAVEPDADNYSSLTGAVIKLGLQARVVTFQAVAADEPGTLLLARNEIHPGDHKIARGTADGIEVLALTVDSLVDDGSENSISLIKIDVQGAEMMVLAGAEKTLSSHRPALFVEVDDSALQHFGSSADQLVTFLGELGYRMHRLTTGGVQPLDRLQLRKELARKRYVDILFLHEGKANR